VRPSPPVLEDGWVGRRGADGAEVKSAMLADDEVELERPPQAVVAEASLIVHLEKAGTPRKATSKGAKKAKGANKAGNNKAGKVDFRRFRKNKVVCGPFKGIHPVLELCGADENDRVQQMRLEEAEAEEYERQADLLFADPKKQRKLKQQRLTRR